MKIKKGDSIVVTTGKDRGKGGTVLRAFPKKDQVLIEGINIIKKHQKSKKRGQAGQIIEHPIPMHVSNVALVDKKTGKAVRVGYAFKGEEEKRKKVRVSRQSGEEL